MTDCHRFLIGRQFTVFTDGAVVRQANNQQNTSLLIQKYLDVLNLVAGRIVHIDGVSNTVADLLSRSPFWRQQFQASSAPSISTNRAIPQAAAHSKPIHQANQKTTTSGEVGMHSFPEWYQALKNYLLDGSMPSSRNTITRARLKECSQRFRLIQDQLQFNVYPYFWVPCCTSPSDIPRWLKAAHEDAGHYGVQTTLQKLQQIVYVPQMTKHTQEWVRTCHQCQIFSIKDPASIRRCTTVASGISMC